MIKDARKAALKIAVMYVITGAVWILISDKFSRILAQDKFELYIFFQQYKGWFFMLATGIILYGLVYRHAYHLLQSQDELSKKDYELLTSHEHYQSLFKHNPDAVFEISKEGQVLSTNPQGEKITGYSRLQLKGMKTSELIAEENKNICHEHFRNVLKGESAKYELKIINQKGQVRLLRSSLLPIVVNSQVVGVFMIARDITNYRRDEELMIASEKMSVIGQLAAAVAHEVRNPLTSLKGFVQVMQATKQVDERYLDIMMAEIDRINLISSEMLILGKKQHVAFEVTNLNEVLKQVLILMEAQANFNNISLIAHYDSKRDLYVMSDPNQLKQVFINIIKNSIEAIINQGEIIVTLAEEEGFAVIQFRDTGIGMSEERVEQVGTPFYSTKEAGTGLGLAVCFKIIERHQGEIEFESEKGKGTLVTVSLPLANE
ncbi:ATP-binding protein [Priestia flexa]|uniref:ATP-binding protein n=1 Tax=Priestia flexa TaxID=86664 RepID=UPI0032EFF0AF